MLSVGSWLASGNASVCRQVDAFSVRTVAVPPWASMVGSGIDSKRLIFGSGLAARVGYSCVLGRLVSIGAKTWFKSVVVT